MPNKLSANLRKDGFFLVKCDSEADIISIIKGGNVMIGKRTMLIKKWDEHFDFKHDILRVVPMRVRFVNLPTKF